MARIDYKTSTDYELLVNFEQVRDQSAFAELVVRHGPMVMATCIRALGHGADAEDAFQATFFALAKGVKRIRNKEVIAGWLHQTAKRTSSSVRRGRIKVPTEHMDSEVADSTADESLVSPMSAAVNREFLEILDEEIGRLPSKLRGVIVLCHLEGLSLSDAAKRLGISPGSAHVRLAKSRERLRTRLLNRGVTITLAGLTTAVLAATKETAAMAVGGKAALLSGQATAFAAGKLASNCAIASSAVRAAEKEVATLFVRSSVRSFSFVVVLLVAVWSVGSLGYGVVRAMTASPNQVSIVLPLGLESTDGNLSVHNDARTVMRTQQLWSSALFSELPEGGAWLVGLSNRLDGAEMTGLTYTENLRLSVSTSPQTSISRVYEDNVGTDVVEVSNAAKPTWYPVSAETNTFPEPLTFDTPFFYDPSKGDLLLDYKTEGVMGNVVFDVQDVGRPVGNFGPINGAMASTLVNNYVVTQFIFDLRDLSSLQRTASERGRE